MAARRAQRPRPLVRRRGQGAPRRAPERPPPTSATAVPARTTSKAATSTARAVSPRRLLAELEPPRDAEAYLCGPAPFMDEISAGLAAMGIDASRIHTEPFGPAPGLTPGIAATPARTPHPPAGQPGDGPTIEFARSNLAIPWSSDYASLLELAEACDVPVRWSCRTGVCHNCETTLIAGNLDYSPDPSNLPPTEARSSAAHSHATTWCSICDADAVRTRADRLGGARPGAGRRARGLPVRDRRRAPPTSDRTRAVLRPLRVEQQHQGPKNAPTKETHGGVSHSAPRSPAGVGGAGERVLSTEEGLDYDSSRRGTPARPGRRRPSSPPTPLRCPRAAAPWRTWRRDAPAASRARVTGRSTLPASTMRGKMWGKAYSVCVSGIFVAPDSPYHRPEDLADVKVGVGYHSGSHYFGHPGARAVPRSAPRSRSSSSDCRSTGCV